MVTRALLEEQTPALPNKQEPKMLLGSLSAERLLSASARTRHWLDVPKWVEKREMQCGHLFGLSACILISLQNMCHIIYCVFF